MTSHRSNRSLWKESLETHSPSVSIITVYTSQVLSNTPAFEEGNDHCENPSKVLQNMSTASSAVGLCCRFNTQLGNLLLHAAVRANLSGDETVAHKHFYAQACGLISFMIVDKSMFHDVSSATSIATYGSTNRMCKSSYMYCITCSALFRHHLPRFFPQVHECITKVGIPLEVVRQVNEVITSCSLCCLQGHELRARKGYAKSHDEC